MIMQTNPARKGYTACISNDKNAMVNVSSAGMPNEISEANTQARRLCHIYSFRMTRAAALTVFSKSAVEWAVETNPASNCDGAK